MTWPLLRIGVLLLAVVSIAQLPPALHAMMAVLFVISSIPLTMRGALP